MTSQPNDRSETSGSHSTRMASTANDPHVESHKKEEAGSTQPEQEIRIAVVMYGGVSLAIYIHGAAQELLRLVRATSGADAGDDEVVKTYRKMSAMVRDQDDSNKTCKTRFVIDILSGTSAGGINAIFLAKAIALRSQSLKQLQETWLEVADMEKLLNRGGPFEPKRSLLRGDWMYMQLLQAFSAMNTQPVDNIDCYTPERLDLFVTTTDLNGVSIPIRLADMAVPEKIHKGSFNFRLDNIRLGTNGELDAQLDQLARNDFGPDFDPMLAFAARCTSSFPIAFAPMKLADIKSAIGEELYKRHYERYRAFFHWIPKAGPASGLRRLDFDWRELADGGYLDNKPFGHAIDAMTFRAIKQRHRRKLFFIDPFPEMVKDQEDRPHFDFLENGMDAAMKLPRYQTIREEINRIGFSNATQSRLRAVRNLVNRNTESAKGDSKQTFNQIIETDFQNAAVVKLTQQFGPVYPTYHAVRLLNTTDDLARTISSMHEPAQSQDFFLAIRYLVRVWREQTYQPNGENKKLLENQFFTDFDYGFRLRRAAYLLEWSQGNASEASGSLIRQLTRLLQTCERLSHPGSSNPIWDAIMAATDLSWDQIKAILEPLSDEARGERAANMYGAHRSSMERIAESIKKHWTDVFEVNRKEMKKLFVIPHFHQQYRDFDFDDMISLSFLEGSDVSEHTETEVYRISPADGVQRPLEKKLAGYALMDFGAFLKRDWRENDILWGRLDASERIVSAVLNDPRDAAHRDELVRELRTAIVRQYEKESHVGLSPALLVPDLSSYLLHQYELPGSPPRGQSASQIAEATDILGRMIEEDVGAKNGLTGSLRRLGRIAEGILALLAPGSLGRVFFKYWLELLFVMTVLFLVIGRIAQNTEVANVAFVGLVVVLLMMILASIAGMWLSGPLPRAVKLLLAWIPALIVTMLLVVGYRHFPEDWRVLWQHIGF